MIDGALGGVFNQALSSSIARRKLQPQKESAPKATQKIVVDYRHDKTNLVKACGGGFVSLRTLEEVHAMMQCGERYGEQLLRKLMQGR